MARRRWLPLLITLLATLTGLALLSPTAAQAHPHQHHRAVPYAALGDSYAAGVGGGKYVNDCLQSRRGYPVQLDRQTRAQLRIFAACSGATTETVLSNQVPALDQKIRLVTLTVGGNDLNVAGVAAACAPGPSADCQSAINAALALLAPQPGGGSILSARLASTYVATVAAAPQADILVTGYPYLFKTPQPNDPNAATIVAINNATTALNATIRSTVSATAERGAKIRYVDVTRGFKGHGIGSRRPYLHTSGPAVYHPTPRGYEVYADALARSFSRH